MSEQDPMVGRVLTANDGQTVPADTPIPDCMYPPEKCPHCDGYQHANRMDEHIATEHTDLPPCTATLANEHTSGVMHCVLRVPHRLGAYGDYHVSARGPIGRTIWKDSADGARPHREGAEETCDRHDVPMTDCVCPRCLADSAAAGR